MPCTASCHALPGFCRDAGRGPSTGGCEAFSIEQTAVYDLLHMNAYVWLDEEYKLRAFRMYKVNRMQRRSELDSCGPFAGPWRWAEDFMRWKPSMEGLSTVDDRNPPDFFCQKIPKPWGFCLYSTYDIRCHAGFIPSCDGSFRNTPSLHLFRGAAYKCVQGRACETLRTFLETAATGEVEDSCRT